MADPAPEVTVTPEAEVAFLGKVVETIGPMIQSQQIQSAIREGMEGVTKSIHEMHDPMVELIQGLAPGPVIDGEAAPTDALDAAPAHDEGGTVHTDDAHHDDAPPEVVEA